MSSSPTGAIGGHHYVYPVPAHHPEPRQPRRWQHLPWPTVLQHHTHHVQRLCRDVLHGVFATCVLQAICSAVLPGLELCVAHHTPEDTLLICGGPDLECDGVLGDRACT